MQSSVLSLQSSVLGCCPPQRFDESREHSLDLRDVFFGRVVAHCGNQSKIKREQQKIFDFTRGTHGEIKEASKVDPCATSASLRDICCDRTGRAAQLRSESEAFLFQKSAGYVVDEQREFVALLPDAQL